MANIKFTIKSTQYTVLVLNADKTTKVVTVMTDKKLLSDAGVLKITPVGDGEKALAVLTCETIKSAYEMPVEVALAHATAIAGNIIEQEGNA